MTCWTRSRGSARCRVDSGRAAPRRASRFRMAARGLPAPDWRARLRVFICWLSRATRARPSSSRASSANSALTGSRCSWRKAVQCSLSWPPSPEPREVAMVRREATRSSRFTTHSGSRCRSSSSRCAAAARSESSARLCCRTRPMADLTSPSRRSENWLRKVRKRPKARRSRASWADSPTSNSAPGPVSRRGKTSPAPMCSISSNNCRSARDSPFSRIRTRAISRR